MKNTKIITVLVVLLMLSAQVHASKISAAKDIVTDLLNVATAGLSGAIGSVLGEAATDALFAQFMKHAFINPIKKALQPDEFKSLLLNCNPELMDVAGNANHVVEHKVNFFIWLLAPFYFLAFLLLAVYLMFVSSSPEGRARAKGNLVRLIISVAFIFFTIPVVQGLLDVSLYFTKLIISTNTGNIDMGLGALREAVKGVWTHVAWNMPFIFWPTLPLFLFILVLSFLPFMVIGLRYFMIIVFTLLFPTGVFLYSMHFTRKVGKTIIRHVALWAFIQPLMAFMLAVIGIASGPLLDSISGSAIKIGFGVAGFIALSATPLLVVGILNWLEVMLVSVEAAMEVPLAHLMATTEELEVKG